MRYCLSLLVVAVLLIGVLGCRGNNPLQRPAYDLQKQRLDASAHDPYADNDAGPEVVGGRPRDFQKPLAEPVRNRPLYERQ